jgi:hypothetical protein
MIDATPLIVELAAAALVLSFLVARRPLARALTRLRRRPAERRHHAAERARAA